MTRLFPSHWQAVKVVEIIDAKDGENTESVTVVFEPVHLTQQRQ